MKTRAQRFWLFITLFLYFFLRLFPAGYFKDFWDDESIGLQETYNKPWTRLLANGSMEASPSPLYHLINKLWHGAWGFFPHAYWDLRIFNRIPHIFYWSLASALSYLFLERFLQKIYKGHYWGNTLIAVGTTIFLHSNTFAIAYSVEDRGYSLWVSLATIQLCFFLDGVFLGFTKKKVFGVAVTSFLAAFGAFSSLALTGCIALYFLYEIYRKRDVAFYFKSLLSLIPAYAIGLWYFSCAPTMGYGKDYFVFSYFLDTVQGVLAKTFRFRSQWAVWISLPIFFTLPAYVFAKNKLALWIRIFAAWALFCAFVFFKGTDWKGGIWAHRYLI